MERENKDFSMFFHQVIDSGIWAKLSPKAKAVYPVLLRHAHYITRNASPSNGTISIKGNISQGNISSATDELVEAGLLKKWRKGWKVFYHLFTKEDITLESAELYLKRKDTLPRKTVTYQRDEKTGEFISKRRKKERNTAKDGVSSTVNYGEGMSVTNGDINRDIEVETLNRDNKERKKEENISSSFSLNSEGQGLTSKHSLKEVSDEALRELKNSMGTEGLITYLEKKSYDEKEIKERLENL